MSDIFIAYRCPGGPGGRNRLSPRFSTIYEIFSDDIFFISDVSTVPRFLCLLFFDAKKWTPEKVIRDFHSLVKITQKVKNLPIYILVSPEIFSDVSPVEEIECQRFS